PALNTGPLTNTAATSLTGVVGAPSYGWLLIGDTSGAYKLQLLTASLIWRVLTAGRAHEISSRAGLTIGPARLRRFARATAIDSRWPSSPAAPASFPLVGPSG